MARRMMATARRLQGEHCLLGVPVLLLLAVCLSGGAWAATIDGYTLSVKSSLITLNVPRLMLQAVGDYTQVLVPGMSNDAPLGAPLLPVQTVSYLVPPGKKVNQVEVRYSQKRSVSGTYIIEPRQRAYPLSYQGAITPTPPDPKVYQSMAAVPGKLFSAAAPQYVRGYQIVTINLYPVEYVPLTGQVSYYEDLTLHVALSDAANAPHPLYRGLPEDQEAVRKVIDNPDALAGYAASALARPSVTYQYLIITTEPLKNAAGAYRLQDLETQKQAAGLTTKILTVDHGVTGIYVTYSGADNQAKIRNAITYYYQNYATEYVLLAGDADGGGILNGETEASPLIPARGLYATVNDGDEVDTNIPADIYYSNLDGTFNADADSTYGESNDNVDLYAEVYVGRAPVDSATEVSNFVAKTIRYENSEAAYLTRASMVGEQLDGVTYGKSYMEEIRLGSSAHGYATQGLAGTGYFDINTLYDADRIWQTSDLVALINNGVHVLNHLGHANVTTFSKQFTGTTADGLTNSDHFFGYTQGCYSGSFDNRDIDNTYENTDCVSEHLVVTAHGAFALVANSRYGWYAFDSTNGLSQRFHRQFWDAVMGEAIVNLGKVLADAKHDNAGLIDSDGMRWAYYEINLLGDPQTPLNAAFLSPTDFSASNIGVGNSCWVTLRWKNSSRSDLIRGMIRYRTDGVYPANSTDGILLCERDASPGAVDTFQHTTTQAGINYHYVAFGANADGDVEGAVATLNRAAVVALGTAGGANDTGRSNCFVATVCYGSPQAAQVSRLRAFRDQHLMAYPGGRDAVKLYYVAGPVLADLLREQEALKSAVRIWIDALVGLIGGHGAIEGDPS